MADSIIKDWHKTSVSFSASKEKLLFFEKITVKNVALYS